MATILEGIRSRKPTSYTKDGEVVREVMLTTISGQKVRYRGPVEDSMPFQGVEYEFQKKGTKYIDQDGVEKEVHADFNMFSGFTSIQDLEAASAFSAKWKEMSKPD